MHFIDLKSQYFQVKDKVWEGINRVLESGNYIMGPEVIALEKKLSEFCQTEYCVTVASGTDALLIALMALDIKPGDEIITPAFTFAAAVEAILLLQAKPVFIDISLKDYNLDCSQLESKITERTKAIIPVDLYGQCADYDVINKIAEKYELVVIEDAGQGLGAKYKGRSAGGLANIGCTSFYPSKPIGCYGDGGACFTNSESLFKAMYEIRDHGQGARYFHDRLGINGRFDTIQAAVVLAKLDIFAEELAQRLKVASLYNNYFKEECANLDIKLPEIAEHNISVYAQYTILVNERDQLQQHLKDKGIPTAIHYPRPLHKQKAYSNSDENVELPNTDHACLSVLSLPMHPYLTEQEILKVVKSVASYYIN